MRGSFWDGIAWSPFTCGLDLDGSCAFSLLETIAFLLLMNGCRFVSVGSNLYCTYYMAF
jgi:hypothetical protein